MKLLFSIRVPSVINDTHYIGGVLEKKRKLDKSEGSSAS